MEVICLGFIRRSGTSRSSGKPYDFFEVSCEALKPQEGYNGKQCKVITVQASIWSDWFVGEKYRLLYNEFGRISSVDLI